MEAHEIQQQLRHASIWWKLCHTWTLGYRKRERKQCRNFEYALKIWICIIRDSRSHVCTPCRMASLLPAIKICQPWLHVLHYQAFPFFRSSKSGKRRTICRSETSFDGWNGSEIVKDRVGSRNLPSCMYFHHTWNSFCKKTLCVLRPALS